ncbi:MAG: response regulator transcription factor [Gemmatimonadales bacterium]
MTVSRDILIIEDNRNLANGLRANLVAEGYEAVVAHEGSTGLMLARTGRFHLIILDLMLPGTDGFRVLDGVRAADAQTPIIVLTARGDETDKVRALTLGADDYVTKPFGIRELLARVASQLRRATHQAAPEAPAQLPRGFGDIEVDADRHRVSRAGRLVELRPKEFELLVALMRHRDHVVSRQDLMQEVWGYDESVESRTLDTHIAGLRRKLEPDPKCPVWILTIRKTGYRLNVDN